MNDLWQKITDLGSGGWLAIAAWVALVFGVVVLVTVNRQIRKNRALRAEQIRPQVSMFMEPHPTDWHIIELVVRNFGQTAAYDVKFDFINAPTVAAYEDRDYDGPLEVDELDLPSELPLLAPGQEWRTVWDSSISREELGGAIRSRFDGTLTYYDGPRPLGEQRSSRWNKRQTFESKICLDWATLQPANRLDLMTEHDLAKREKQKLELLRALLNYFHHASRETRPEVFRAEIDRVNRAAAEAHDRLKTRQVDPASLAQAPSGAHAAPPTHRASAEPAEQTTVLDFPWIEGGNGNGDAQGHGNRDGHGQHGEQRALPEQNWANRR